MDAAVSCRSEACYPSSRKHGRSWAVKRREFITLLGGAAAWPLAARAQQVSTRRPLVAVLSAVTRERNLPLNAFVQGMREFGYVEGQNIDIEYRFAEGRLDR